MNSEEYRQKEIVFHKAWFERHQAKLLRFANNKIGRRILRIDGKKSSVGKNRIIKIEPHAITWRNLDNTYSTEFRTHAKFAKRLYYAFKPIWQLMHIWDSITSPIPYLNLGFDTLTAYPDSHAESNTVDGRVSEGYNQYHTWSFLRDGAGSNATDNDDIDFALRIACGATNAWSGLLRSIFLFDTSSIGADSTISSASLSLAGWAKGNDVGTLDAAVVSSNPASNTGLVAGDYDSLGSVLYSEVHGYNDLTTDASYLDFSLNSTGIAAISQDGITKFGIRNKTHDIDNSEPTWTAVSAISYWFIYFAETTGNTQDPKLVVNYASAGTPTNALGASHYAALPLGYGFYGQNYSIISDTPVDVSGEINIEASGEFSTASDLLFEVFGSALTNVDISAEASGETIGINDIGIEAAGNSDSTAELNFDTLTEAFGTSEFIIEAIGSNDGNAELLIEGSGSNGASEDINMEVEGIDYSFTDISFELLSQDTSYSETNFEVYGNIVTDINFEVGGSVTLYNETNIEIGGQGEVVDDTDMETEGANGATTDLNIECLSQATSGTDIGISVFAEDTVNDDIEFGVTGSDLDLADISFEVFAKSPDFDDDDNIIDSGNFNDNDTTSIDNFGDAVQTTEENFSNETSECVDTFNDSRAVLSSNFTDQTI